MPHASGVEDGKMLIQVSSNEEVKKYLIGRTIVDIDLNLLPGDDQDEYSGIPTLILDDGKRLRFNVDDYGSGTYGVNLEVSTPE
jgi:hypothetical protein